MLVGWTGLGWVGFFEDLDFGFVLHSYFCYVKILFFFFDKKYLVGILNPLGITLRRMEDSLFTCNMTRRGGVIY